MSLCSKRDLIIKVNFAFSQQTGRRDAEKNWEYLCPTFILHRKSRDNRKYCEIFSENVFFNELYCSVNSKNFKFHSLRSRLNYNFEVIRKIFYSKCLHQFFTQTCDWQNYSYPQVTRKLFIELLNLTSRNLCLLDGRGDLNTGRWKF